MCVEEKNAGSGLSSTGVSLLLHFAQYPTLYDVPVPDPGFAGRIWITACCAALNTVYGVDYQAAPAAKITQLSKADKTKSNVLYGFVYYLVVFFYLVYAFFAWTYSLGSTLFNDRVVGSRQVSGEKNARVFLFNVELKNDPECVKQLRFVVKTIVDMLPDRQVIPNSYPVIDPASFTRVEAGRTSAINSDKAYTEPGGFVLHPDQLYVSPHEILVDVCPNNDKKNKKFMSSFLVTNRRLVQHVASSGGRGVGDYSQLHMWVLDGVDGDFLFSGPLNHHYGYDPIRGEEILASTRRFGGLHLDVQHHEFGIKLLQVLAHTRAIVEQTTPPLLTREEWNAKSDLQCAVFTKELLYPEEEVEACLHSEIQVSALKKSLAKGYLKNSVITFSDRGIYLEVYKAKGDKSKKRHVSFITWDKVEGVSVSNFQPRNSLCVSDKLHRGSKLQIGLKGATSFSLCIEIPNRFYGSEDAELDALIRTITGHTSTGATTWTGTATHDHEQDAPGHHGHSSRGVFVSAARSATISAVTQEGSEMV
eukprot:gene29749-36844_t